MKRNIVLLWLSCLLVFSWLSGAGVQSGRAADVVISEFMARNANGLRDEDGARPDWIELHNVSAATVNLDGWYLTDTTNDLTKWRFPAVSLAANGYLVVFASDKNRTNPAAPLHANFQLTSGGEYLGLVMPDGVTVASEFRPAYPPQEPDIAYGIGAEVTITPLVAAGAPARVLVPVNGLLGTAWTSNGFDASSWNSATTGVGFSPQGAPSSGGL
jgi:hypothetical protein